MSLKLVLLIILGEIFICAAQFMFKLGANKLTSHKISTLKGYIKFINAAVRIPAVWVGFSLNVIAVMVWILVLALVDLSLAIPLDSVHYIMIMLGAHFFLKERLTWDRIASTIFIVGGIFLVALS